MGFALSLVPLVMTGQLLGTVRLTIADQTDVSISSGSCGSSLTGNVTTAITATNVCSSLQLWVTDGDCGDAPVTANQDLVIPEISQQELQLNRNQNKPVTFSVNAMPFFKKATSDGGTGCGSLGVDITHKFCAAVTLANDISCLGKTIVKATTPVTIHYDTLAPLAPTITSLEAFEGAAAVTVEPSDDDTAKIVVQRKGPNDADFVTVETLTTSKNTTIEGLENGVTYEVRAIAYDAVTPDPNESPPSEVKTVTPRESTGFWDACRAAGCQNGGCNAAAAGPLGLAALALMMLIRRMRR